MHCPKLRKSNIHRDSKHISALLHFTFFFPAVIQVTERKVFVLWVLVVVWDPGAQSCRVLLQILIIILILILFMLYSHGCMFHERHVL